jgi:class 3 adenylate cyclase
MVDEVFDLYDREKILLVEGQQILDNDDPILIKEFAVRLFDRFGKLVRENEDLTRHSDRQEQRLVKLNRNLKLQSHEVEQQRQSFENLSIQLSKYLPPQIHQAMFAGKYDTQVTTTRKKLTVFFSDIQNFTRTTDSLQPEELTEYLNEYFSEMTQIALSYGATIDKYIGDAVMLFFGDPESKGVREDARSCVKMALEMQEQMKVLQHRWRARGFSNPFVIRIGINTGYCNVGNFGSEQRLSYTIIGGEVNVAQRLESASDAGGILISQETYLQVEDLVEVQERHAVNLKGIDRHIRTYAVKGYLEDSHQKIKISHPAGIHIDVQLLTLTHEQREEIGDKLIDLARQIKP